MTQTNINTLPSLSLDRQQLINKAAKKLAESPQHIREAYLYLLDRPELVKKVCYATDHLESKAKHDAFMAMVQADMEVNHG